MSYSVNLQCFSYSCSDLNPDQIANMNCTNKIRLPPSVLKHLMEDVGEKSLEFPLFFSVKNTHTMYSNTCAVHEFSSPEGVCNLPFHIMQDLSVNEGDNIEIQLVCLVNGSFIKLRPHKTKFIDLTNPKAVLEKYMSLDYPVVTKGHTILINYKDIGEQFYIDIVDCEPADTIKIINTDVNVDFDTPCDYVEPPKIKTTSPENTLKPVVAENTKIEFNRKPSLNDFRKTNSNTFVPFSGIGRKLGSE